MKAKVNDTGLLVPRAMLEGLDEVEMRVEDGRIVISPLRPDPIMRLGQRPLDTPEVDVSERQDDYLYFDRHVVQGGFEVLPTPED
jgi:hypothetical protein